MMSSLECLAQADRLDEQARQCGSEKERAALTETAIGWRRIAILARQQEAWEAENHPAGWIPADETL